MDAGGAWNWRGNGRSGMHGRHQRTYVGSTGATRALHGSYRVEGTRSLRDELSLFLDLLEEFVRSDLCGLTLLELT